MPAEPEVESVFRHNLPAGFPRCYRLRKRSLIRSLFQTGSRFSSGRLLFYFIWEETQTSPAMVISIKKKYGHAPARNRAKRLIREAFKNTPIESCKGLRFAVSLLGNSTETVTGDEIRHSFRNFIFYLVPGAPA